MVNVMKAVHGQTGLLEVIEALRPRRRLAHPSGGRHQQGNANGDDGDDDQEFDEREAGAGCATDSVHGVFLLFRLQPICLRLAFAWNFPNAKRKQDRFINLNQ